MSTRIWFNEVVTRDGFQNEPTFVSTAAKIALVNALSHCGYAKIEVTSFTSAKAIPMLRDAEEVMGQIRRVPGVEYTVLVPNVRGAERAIESLADELNVVMSVSETHNLANLRLPREKSITALAEVIRMAGIHPSRTPVNVSLSTAFGCPMEGPVLQDEVLRWADRFAALGVRGLTVCDTIGMAHPIQVAKMAEALQQRFPMLQLTMHFHNTRGMGLANVLSSVQAGIVRFDGSLGGLGGCPYAPGASGNICSEDAIHMLQCMGYDIGIDFDALIAIAQGLPQLVSHSIPGQMIRAGRISKLHAAPEEVGRLCGTTTVRQ